VRLVGKVGADVLGRATLDVLRSHGENLADEMIISAHDHSSYTIVLSPPGVDRSFLHYPGANHTFSATDIGDRHLAGASWLHFGYPPLMRSIYMNDGAELVTIFERAHAAGLATSLDMADVDPNAPPGRVDWVAWLTNVLPHVDVFLPSLDEILFMLRAECSSAGESPDAGARSGGLLADIAGRLLELGPAIVGLKLGDAGFHVQGSAHREAFGRLVHCSALDPDTWLGCEVRTPCFQVEVRGTTGAGDATIAGFIAAVLQGLDPSDAATMAVAVGACSVEAADASSGVLPWAAVLDRVAAGWKRLGAAGGAA
jgi:sugar/nucleoside kinase (ribokinase family)